MSEVAETIFHIEHRISRVNGNTGVNIVFNKLYKSKLDTINSNIEILETVLRQYPNKKMDMREYNNIRDNIDVIEKNMIGIMRENEKTIDKLMNFDETIKNYGIKK
jgi:hypothetical protein